MRPTLQRPPRNPTGEPVETCSRCHFSFFPTSILSSWKDRSFTQPDLDLALSFEQKCSQVLSAFMHEKNRLEKLMEKVSQQKSLLENIYNGEQLGRVDFEADFQFEICDRCHFVFPDPKRVSLPRRSSRNAEKLKETAGTLAEALGSESRQIDFVASAVQRALNQFKAYADELKIIVTLPTLKVSIYELPLELLTEIFTLCIEDGTDKALDFRMWTMVQGTTPMVLSRVCSYWRVILHSTPRFWSSISIGLAHTIPDKLLLDRSLQHAKLHLKYSGDISLRISAHAILARDAPGDVRQLFDAFADHGHRWESMKIYVSGKDFNSISFPSTLPRLTHLSCTAYYVAGAQALLPKFDAPLLRSLELENVALFSGEPLGSPVFHPRTGPNTVIDLSNLTAMDLRLVPLSEVFSSLHRACNLERLRLSTVYKNSTHNELLLVERPGHFVLSSCKSVSFAFAFKEFEPDLTVLFDRMAFPNLLEIDFSGAVKSEYPVFLSNIPSFVPMLRRSNCGNITTFSLACVVVTDHDLLDILAILPSINDLTLDERLPGLLASNAFEAELTRRIFTMHFLDRLSGHGILLKKLARIRFVFRDRKFNDTALVDMIKSRWSAESKSLEAGEEIRTADLERVSLSIPKRRITSWLRRELGRLRESGMDI
ncbi:hypothetical protein VKT23_008132 [Stygiomarasmius scandens]|uniref:F-box domain-containing protein n=1 Tax=Marasmiellus scandens TaxID=2682957 RepID=A0ABR1JMQ5_9AGAR